MSGDPFEVTIWGARGSTPVSGPDFAAFGGATMSVGVRCGAAQFIFDAGSGIHSAGRALHAVGGGDCEIFFTHSHYDHIIGLPFFKPFYVPGRQVGLWMGHHSGQMTTAEIVDGFMRPPYFPVGREMFKADLALHDFAPGDVLTPAPGVRIETRMLSHPGGSVGYRIEYGGRVLALVYDLDHVPGTHCPNANALMRDADLALYDATFTDSEFCLFHDFGHSTWQQGLRLAGLSGARRIGLVHHAPFRTDDQLAAIEAEAQAVFSATFCASEGQVITL